MSWEDWEGGRGGGERRRKKKENGCEGKETKKQRKSVTK